MQITSQIRKALVEEKLQRLLKYGQRLLDFCIRTKAISSSMKGLRWINNGRMKR
jgi:hypothetical protein